MGEAKRRADMLRKSMLEEIDLWLAPANDYEEKLANEIAAMPVVSVRRPPRDDILRAGMKAQQCHQNCISYCQIDPERKSKIVPGWWIKGDSYISHSVVNREDILFCVTPYLWDEREFLFVPDDKIKCRIDPDGSVVTERDGRPLELRVRSNPERTIRQCGKMKKLVLNGMEPLKAWQEVMPDK